MQAQGPGIYVKFLGLWTLWVDSSKARMDHINIGCSFYWLISSNSSHGEWAGFNLLYTNGDHSDVCAISEHGHFSDAETWGT